MVRVRAGTVEPVFGNLINYYGLRKINTKGIQCAHKYMLMSALVFNLKKLLKFISKKALPKYRPCKSNFALLVKLHFMTLLSYL